MQNMWLKAIDLLLQAMALHQMLESGSPVALVGGYVLLICVNALSYAALILISSHSALTEVRVDTVYVDCSLASTFLQVALTVTSLTLRFDLIFAVLVPIVVICYSENAFKFDRATFIISMELLPEGSFERCACMIADPVQICSSKRVSTRSASWRRSISSFVSG